MPEGPRYPPWWPTRSPRPPSPVVLPLSPAWPALCLCALLGHLLFQVWRSCLAYPRRVVPSVGPQTPVTMLHPGPRLVPLGWWQGTCDLPAPLPCLRASRWSVTLWVPALGRFWCVVQLESGLALVPAVDPGAVWRGRPVGAALLEVLAEEGG